MNIVDNVAVCSRSFSKNANLKEQLLNRYQNVWFNDLGSQLEGQSLVDFLRGKQKVIVGLERIDDLVLAACPDIKVISKYGVGLDGIDLMAMRKRGVKLGWKGGVNKRSVSELVLSNMINLLRLIPSIQSDLVNGKWRPQIGRQLSGRTIGVIGSGFIGQDLIRLLQPFGCDIIVNDPVHYADFFDAYDVTTAPLDVLLREADIVTLHTPLTKHTKNLLNVNNMSQMKSNAIIINTARGGLVDEIALKSMLIDNKLAGAAFDVFENEPIVDIELLSLTNFIATSHIGGSTEEAVFEMGKAAIEGLDENFVPDF